MIDEGPRICPPVRVAAMRSQISWSFGDSELRSGAVRRVIVPPLELLRQRIQDVLHRRVGLAGGLLSERRITDEAIHVGGTLQDARREADVLKRRRDLLHLADPAARFAR